MQKFGLLEIVARGLSADDPDNVYAVVRGDPGHAHQLALVLREAELFAALDHPNIIKLIGVLRDAHGDVTALVMELASGTLQSLCEERGVGKPGSPGSRTGLDLETLRGIFLGAARGLVYLHGLPVPIYHRDLKPDNLFLFVDDAGGVLVAKLGDFSDAKVGC